MVRDGELNDVDGKTDEQDAETTYPAVQPFVLNVLQDIEALKPTSATSLGLEKRDIVSMST